MSDELLTTIKLVVDAAGVQTGVTSARREIADLGRDVKKITDETNAALKQVGSDTDLGKGVSKATKSAIKDIGDLSKQIKTFETDAFNGFSGIGRSAEAAYVKLVGGGVNTQIADQYVAVLKTAQGLSAKQAAEAAKAAEIISSATKLQIAEEAHYADLKKQWAASNKAQADQEIAATKARTAALAAYYAEARNAELNLIHTGRGKSSALLTDKGLDLGLTQAEISNSAVGKIRGIEAATAAAFAAANPNLVTLQKNAEAAGTSMKGFSASMRNVPAQFTDIVASLQGGQRPLTVLLQQGGQLKDMFGGVGNAARALGGYVLGLINPFTIVAAAVGTLAVAYFKGSAESEAYNKTLILTGNAVGTTANRMSEMARAIDATSFGITQSKAAEVLNNIAASGGVSAASLQRFTAIAIEFERSGAGSAESVGKAFSDLANDPLSASEKLNKSVNYLTLDIYNQIKALEDQGRTTEAASVAQSAYASEMESRIPKLVGNLGYLQQAWMSVKAAASEAWDFMLNVGREDTSKEKMQSAFDKIKEISGQSSFTITDEVRQIKIDQQLAVIAGLEKEAAASAAVAAADKRRFEATQAGIALSKSAVVYETDVEKMRRKTMEATVQYETALRNTTLTQAARNQLEKDYLQTVSGITKVKEKSDAKDASAKKVSIVGESEVASIRARIIIGEDYLRALKTEGIATKEKNEGEKLAIKIQKELEGGLQGVALANKQKALSAAQSLAAVLKESDALEGLLTAQRDFEKLRDKEIAGQEASIVKMEEKAQAMEDEVRMYGLGKEAIEALSIARLQERIDILGGFDNSAEQISLIEKEIDARKRLAVATDAKSGKVAADKYADDLRKANQKAAEESSKYWEDALMRAFESGKGFFESLWDTIKNTLKTQVLKVTIQGVMGSLGIGAAGAANAGSGVGVSDITTAYSAYDKFVSGFSSTAASMKDIGTTIGTTIGKMTQPLVDAGFDGLANATNSLANGVLQNAELINTASDILGYAAAVYSLSEGKYATAAGQAIGTFFGGAIGSYIGGAIGGWIDDAIGWGGETRSGASYITGADGKAAYKEGPSGGEIAGDSARKMFDATQSTIQNTLVALGSKSVLTGYVAGLESSKSGKGFEYAGGYIDGKGFGEFGGRSGGQFAMESQDGQQAFTDYGTQLAQSIIEALQATPDIPKTITDIINQTLGDAAVSSLSVEATTKLLDTLNAVAGTVTAFSVAIAGMPFEQLKNLSFDAAAGLIAASGGMEKLGTNLGAYYTNFYSAEEQRLQTIKNINTATAGSGLDAATATRDQFRLIVESQDLATESGQRMYAALLGVSSAFAGITPATLDASQALGDAAKAASDAAKAASDAAKVAADAAIAAAEAAAEATTIMLQGLLDSAGLGVDAALTSIFESVDAQRTAITDTYNTQSGQINASLATVGASIGKLQSLSSSLNGTLDGMRISGSDSAYRADAQAQITAALATARSGGGLPMDGQLASALRTVGQPSQQLYGNFVDYARDFYKTANDLSSLSDLTDAQLTGEELTQSILEAQSTTLKSGFDAEIKRLDELVKSAQAQADGVTKTTAAILSLTDALEAWTASLAANLSNTLATAFDKVDINKSSGIDWAEFQKSFGGMASEATLKSLFALTDADGDGMISQLEAIKANTANLLAVMSISGAGGISAGAGKYTGTEVAKAITDMTKAGATTEQIIAAAGNNYGVTSSSVAAVAAVTGNTGITAYQAAADAATELDLATRVSITAQLQAMANAQGITLQRAAYNYAIANGINAATVDKQLGFPNGASNAWAAANGLPAFAKGINYVPNDMTARIHEGEAVIPAAFNPFNPNAQQNGNNDTAAALRAMADRLDRIEANTRATAGHTAGTDRKLARVIPGNALITEAA